MSLLQNRDDVVEARVCVALDRQLAMVSVEDSIEALLGFTADDYRSGHVSLKQQIHPHDNDIADTLFSSDDPAATGTFNIRLRHADGRIRCIYGQYRKELGANGLALHLLLQDPKTLQRTLSDVSTVANFTAMMENADDYIYFKDRNHVLTGASQTLVSICDAPAEHWTDLLGQTDYDVFPEELADIYYRLEKQIFAGVPVAREVQQTQTKDGKKGWVDNRKYPVRNDHGEIIGLFGIARDITENEQAVMALIANKHRLTAVMENLTEGLVIADQQGVTTYWNPQALAINGFASMADCQRPLAEFAQLFELRPLNEDRLLPVEEWPMSRVLRGEELHDWEVRLRRLDQGWEKVLTYSGWFIRGADDETLAFLSIIDITDRKDSEKKYRTLFENMVEQVHFWKLVRDKQGNIKTWRLVDANSVSLESWQRTRAQTIGKTADEIWPNSNATELFMPIVKKIFEEGTPHRWESYFAETNQTLSMTSAAFGEYFFSSGLDITERRQAEQTLQESEERYRSLVEMTFDGVWEVDTQGRYTYASPRMSTMLGYQPDEVLGRTPFDFMPADEAQRVKVFFEGIMAARQTFSVVENVNLHRDGGLVFLETSGAPILSPEGTLLGYRGVDRDITQRKNSELQLVRDNLLLKTQQDLSPDGILIVDENDNIISFNQKFCKIWDIPDHIMAEQSSEKAMQYVLPLLINPDEFVKRIRDLFQDKKAHSFEEITLTNGKILARHSSPMFGSDAQYYGRVWFYRDITERKQAEVELRAKVEALRASYAELEQFNRAMVDRELRMIELKQEINDLCRRLGEPPRHATDQFQTGHIRGTGPAPALPGEGDA